MSEIYDMMYIETLIFIYNLKLKRGYMNKYIFDESL